METLWKHCGRIAIIIIRSNQSEGVGAVTSIAWDRLDGAWDSAPWMAISANLNKPEECFHEQTINLWPMVLTAARR